MNSYKLVSQLIWLKRVKSLNRESWLDIRPKIGIAAAAAAGRAVLSGLLGCADYVLENWLTEENYQVLYELPGEDEEWSLFDKIKLFKAIRMIRMDILMIRIFV